MMRVVWHIDVYEREKQPTPANIVRVIRHIIYQQHPLPLRSGILASHTEP